MQSLLLKAAWTIVALVCLFGAIGGSSGGSWVSSAFWLFLLVSWVVIGLRVRRDPTGLFRTKSIDALIAASEDPGKKLRRSLGPWSLTALGIGAVIGSGIFTLTGTAAAGRVMSTKSILNATVLDLVGSGSWATSQRRRPRP